MPITSHANAEPVLKLHIFTFLPSPLQFCFSVLQTAMAVLSLSRLVSSMINLLNDDIYRRVCVTIIVSSFREIEQGVHYIRKSLHFWRKQW